MENYKGVTRFFPPGGLAPFGSERKTDPNKVYTKQKDKRNKVYLLCGIVMILCIAGIAVGMLWLEELSAAYHLVFWFESIALIAFGFSWVVKAEFLFMKDKGDFNIHK